MATDYEKLIDAIRESTRKESLSDGALWESIWRLMDEHKDNNDKSEDIYEVLQDLGIIKISIEYL